MTRRELRAIERELANIHRTFHMCGLDAASAKDRGERMPSAVQPSGGSLLSAEINALPERVRSFIHDLETRADPAGDVRRAHIAEENVAALTAKLAEIERTTPQPDELPTPETGNGGTEGRAFAETTRTDQQSEVSRG
jgi:hypothetical protein